MGKLHIGYGPKAASQIRLEGDTHAADQTIAAKPITAATHK